MSDDLKEIFCPENYLLYAIYQWVYLLILSFGTIPEMEMIILILNDKNL